MRSPSTAARQPAGTPTGGQFTAAAHAETGTALTDPTRPAAGHLPVPDVRACRVCGCTDDAACSPPCWWVGEDLCSACQATRAVQCTPPVAPDVIERTHALDPREHLDHLAARVTPDELDRMYRQLRGLRHHTLDDTVTTAAGCLTPEHRAEGELVLRRLANERSQYGLAIHLAERVRLARTLIHGSPYRRS